MAITPHFNSVYSNAYDMLFAYLKPLERDVHFVYSDQPAGKPGVPTLSIGYALIINTSKTKTPNWEIREAWETDFAGAGINLTAPQLADLKSKLKQALGALRGEQGATNPFNPYTGTNALGWTIDDNQSLNLFKYVAPSYEGRIKKWLGNDALYGEIYGSQEMAALFSLAWNGMINGAPYSQNLRRAILAGDRAEAWFSIRYQANYIGSKSSLGLPLNARESALFGDGIDKGWANRRYKEAETFDLYDTASNKDALAEAKGIYRMLTLHRKEIEAYEKVYGVAFDGSLGTRGNNTGSTGRVIHNAIAPACTQILADLANHGNADIRAAYAAWANAPGNYLTNLNVTNLYLDPGRTASTQSVDPNNSSEIDARRYSGGVEVASNDILVGDSVTIGVGGDILLGGKGDDLLIGGSGNDYLWGGQGNDFMAGGAGNDVYIMNSGDGTDIIEDKQGVNRIEFNGKVVKSFARESGGITFHSFDGGFTAIEQGGEFIITDVATGDKITLNQNFQEGDFGIDFVDALTDPTITRTIVGDLSPIDPNSPTYDDLGNVVTDPAQPAPNRADYLQDSTGNDDIRGLGGTDIIEAWRGGDDKLDGGTGDDIVAGRDGNDIVIGGEGMDLLRGDAGRDKLYAGGEVTLEALLTAPDAPASGLKGDFLDAGDGDDTLVGDVGNDALAGGDGADIIVGGAGDDNIKGDLTTSMIAMDWSVTRSTSVDANGTTVYSMVYNNVSFISPTVGGADVIYAGAGVDWANGQQGDDYLDGGSGDDVLFGDAGHDILLGGTGNDDLIGDNTDVAAADQGDDYLDGGDGNDTLNGDGGSDVLFGGIGNDKLYGDSEETLVGNDYLDGEEGDDFLWGGGGNDDLRGGDGIDTLHGGAGDDYLDGGVGTDTLAGMAGADVLYGGDGADFLQGDSGTGVDEGNDYLDGEAGDDVLLGEGGDDILVGGAGADMLQGGAGLDELSGDEGMDTLVGGDGDDTLYGGLDNDQLAGDAGNDYLDGGDGDNVIDAGAGNDTAYGGTGVDRIYGKAGDDYLDGADGNDELQGEDGNDVLEGGTGDDVLFGQAGADTLSGGDGADQIVGGTENDALYGDAGDDVIWGEAGDDVLAGGLGNDTLQGGLGGDTYQFGRGDGQDIVFDSDATAGSVDRIQFAPDVSSEEVFVSQETGTYNLRLQIGNTTDVLAVANHFYSAADQVEEIRFADGTVWTPASMPTFLQGSAGSDVLNGTTGNDVLRSGTGNDVIHGGTGDDTYQFFLGDGADYIVDYDTNTGNVDKIVFWDGILASQVRASRSGDDLLLTVDAMNVVGVSNYFANDGYTPYAVEQIKFLGDGTVWNLDAVKQMALTGSGGNDVLSGYATGDQLLGLAGDDTLQGGAGNDVLDGGVGNDSLIGGAGNDLYVFARGDGVNTVDDGDLTAGNTDTIQFAADILPTDVKLRRTSFNSLEISIVGDTTVVNVPFQFGADGSSAGGIERIEFLADSSFWDGAMIASMVSAATEGNDVLYGFDAQSDSLGGAGGNDALYGGGGNDTLSGGAGDDSLYGGAGSDSYVVGLNGGADVVAENPGGLSTDVDRLTFVDGINYADATFTREGNDLLIGSAAKGFNVRLANQFGSDPGANGIEQVAFADVTLDRSALGLEVGVGTPGDDVLNGSASNDQMDGLGGNDLIYGQGGDDTLSGGVGNDTLYGGAGSDTYIVGLNGGVDVVDEASGGLSSDIDRLVFVDAINYVDAMFQRDGDDLLISDPTKGFDVRVVNQFGTDPNANGVEQVVFADGTTLDRAAVIAKLTTPTEGSDALYGGATDDFLDGLGGNDLIYGFDGNDTLRGGTGSDTLYGGNGNDTYIFEYGGGYDLISDADSFDPAVGGKDALILGPSVTVHEVGYYFGKPDMTLADTSGNIVVTIVGYYSKGNFEEIIQPNGYVITQQAVGQSRQLLGTGSADTLNGTNIPDFISGQLGNDLIYGWAGDDTLYGGGGNDTIYGGAGADYIEGFDSDLAVDMFYGGAGNDRYTVSDQLDVIVEYAGEGVDTVWAFDISYTLGAEIENLKLVSPNQALNGTGNDLSNILEGNDLKNVLTGYGGNDTLIGGLGVDTMIGGTGDDTYYVDDSRDAITENLNEGMDSVQSSVSHTLDANVEVLTLTGTAAITGTDNGLNNLLIGNGADNTLTAGTGNDLLQGGAGNDIVKDTAGNNMLDGGAGTDALTGGSGRELFIGGAGNDTITTGSGADIIAFNRGDGQDVVVASTGTDNTISLGGGIQYANLTMRKSGSDLILDTGNSEQLTLQNWYKGTTNHSVLNLQLVLDATSYDPASPDSLLNQRVQTFNFTTLTNGFDQALAADPNLTSWSLTNALLTAHLSGSDSAALGGDLAYQYNLNGSVSGIGLAPAQSVVSDANFGTAAQTLRPLSELQTGSVRLS